MLPETKTSRVETVTTTGPVISIKHLHKAFGDNKVLSGLTIHLNKGENVTVLGIDFSETYAVYPYFYGGLMAGSVVNHNFN